MLKTYIIIKDIGHGMEIFLFPQNGNILNMIGTYLALMNIIC
jgi:hypothetical protein